MMFDTEKFIHAVKCRPALYNPKCDGYFSRDVKFAKWKEIGIVMYQDWDSLPDDDRELKLKGLSTRWRSIRDHFVKELRITKTASKKKRKYIYFDELKFLLPTVEKQSSRNASDSENEAHTSNADDIDMITSNISVDAEDIVVDPDRYRGYECERIANVADMAPDVGTLLEVQQHEHGMQYGAGFSLDDEDQDIDYQGFHDKMGNEAFLMSLLPILNKLPFESVMDVRVEIMQTLQRYARLKSE